MSSKILIFFTINLANNLIFSSSDVQFYLYNERNPFKSLLLDLKNEKTFRNFNPALPTRIFVHGWMANYWAAFFVGLGESYSEKRKINLILVNWDQASNLNYFKSLDYTNETGVEIGKFIKYLVSRQLTNYDNIYIIGHSLGAHIAGFAGKYLYPNRVDTIIGLDPASIGFPVSLSRNRIDKTDANYVQIIHTDTSIFGAGIKAEIGDSDFFPNGGLSHPHCSGLSGMLMSCNHIASIMFFVESINSNIGFYGLICKKKANKRICKCDNNDCVQYKLGGEPIDKKAQGYLYLETNYDSPYVKGKFNTTFYKEILMK